LSAENTCVCWVGGEEDSQSSAKMAPMTIVLYCFIFRWKYLSFNYFLFTPIELSDGDDQYTFDDCLIGQAK
jgi:hypothetical protein